MNIKKLIDESKSVEVNLTEQIGFKINPTVKEEFVELCVKNNVSMGKLFRNFVTDVMTELKE